MPGDDKEIIALWRKTNKEDRKDTRQMRLAPAVQHRLEGRLAHWNELSALPELTPVEIETKKQRFRAFTDSADAFLLAQIAAIPIAQFYVPKTLENNSRLVTDSEFRRYWVDGQTPQSDGTATALAKSIEKRFFHWFLEFPDIIARGGFDCILGNPPYLGGQALSGTYGHSFCGYVKWEFAPTGLSDLVVFFLRRFFTLLGSNGFTAFITTNSIKDGDIRKDGLEQVITQGGEINMAVRGIKWPGKASLVVSLLAVHKGMWQGKHSLDQREAAFINAFLEDNKTEPPAVVLSENCDRVYQGAIPLGDAFYLSNTEAHRLVQADARNRDVVFFSPSGKEDINGAPDQAPSRSIICFHDWDEAKARIYALPFQLVENRVRHAKELRSDDEMPLAWWRFLRPRMEMTSKLKRLRRCFVSARTTKYLSFSACPSNYVFTDSIYVFTQDRWDLYAVLQSTLHEVWARKYSGALETRLRYSPTDCFETFAFPASLWNIASPGLASIGEQHHEHRKSLMLSAWLGLTDIYNLFHARALTPAMVAKVSKKSPEEAARGYEGLLELRRLHVQLDVAIRDAYGWQGLPLDHDFYEVETLPEDDRVRYTISPAARKEVLRLLLALNQERAAQEAAAALEAKRQPKEKAASGKKKEGPQHLFVLPNLTSVRAGEWARPIQNHQSETGAQLAALLKAMDGPLPKRQVILAAVLSLEPNLLLPYLDAQEADNWRKGIGHEADPLPRGIAQFIARTDPAWGAAVRNLRTNSHLIEDLRAGTWAPGNNLHVFATGGWPDGRAGIVLNVLKRQSADTIITALPTDLRRWIDAVAA